MVIVNYPIDNFLEEGTLPLFRRLQNITILWPVTAPTGGEEEGKAVSGVKREGERIVDKNVLIEL